MFMKKLFLTISLVLIVGLNCSPCFAEKATLEENNYLNNAQSHQKKYKPEIENLIKEANSYIVKDHKKTIELYENVLKIDPTCDEAYYNIGSMYLWEKEPEKSLEYFKKALKYNPKNVLAYSAIAVNCDVLANYELTAKYIAEYRKAFPNDKLNNDVADKLEKTSKSKKEYSDKLTGGIIPRVSIDVTAPLWIPGSRIDLPQMQASQLIHRGSTVNTTPEALTFMKLKGIAPRAGSLTDFAQSYSNNIRKQHSYNFKSKIVEEKSDYIIFETSFSGQYDIYKASMDAKSVYLMEYTLKAQDFPNLKRQYWINVLKKSNFITWINE